MAVENPAVSVIVPMYNSEKYIVECFQCLLNQTLKNFEVIVVDDCSTDNSAKIVEKYLTNENIQIKLIHTEKNTGGAGIPRNIGLENSRGKYIFFMDSDDFISKKALETLYNVSEESQAEVLMCKKHFEVPGNVENFFEKKVLISKGNEDFEWASEDLDQRLISWTKGIYQSAVWLKFLRRDFLIESDIKFLPIQQEDYYWNLEVIFSAKKLLLVPLAFYIYRRELPNSLQNTLFNPELTPDSIYKKFDGLFNGLKHIDDFLGRLEFFQKNPAHRFFIIDRILERTLHILTMFYGNSSPFEVYENFKTAYSKETGQFDILISCLVSNLIHKSAKLNPLDKKVEESKSKIGKSNKKDKRKKK